MQNEERQLAGYFNEENGISAVECLLPLHYKNLDTLSVYIIETPSFVVNAQTFFYLFSQKSSFFGTYVFTLLSSNNNATTHKPDPLNSLTWLWRTNKEEELFSMVTILPVSNWAPFICDKIAQGVCAGLLSMDFTDKETQQRRWEIVINNTIDHLSGLNHGGKEN